MRLPPKNYPEASVFQPANLLREARRQKGIREGKVPAICVLDPDGDILDYLLRSNQGKVCPSWACYHTKLYEFHCQGIPVGIIAQAVGASFAVLLAEQLFMSGCELLISITSAGVINPPAKGSKFILIEEALRDEGTSYHYLPADQPARLGEELRVALRNSFETATLSVEGGMSWTTDAPYRETQAAIDFAKAQGVTCVEMEAAALYAFAQARQRQVVCFAHLTNTMAQQGDDFEKGRENGSLDSLALIAQTAQGLLAKSSVEEGK